MHVCELDLEGTFRRMPTLVYAVRATPEVLRDDLAASRRAGGHIMSKWFGDPPGFDPDLASDIVDSVWKERELLDDNGDLLRTELAGLLKDIFESKHFVNQNTEDAINKGAVTKVELAKELLGLNGADTSILKATTPEEKAAQTKIMSIIWECCGTALNSPLSKRLQYLGGPVLIETTVPRHYTSAEREDLGELSEDRQGRLISTNFDIILAFSNDNEIKKLRQAALRYDKYLGKIGERHPLEKGRLAAAAAAILPQILESVSNAAPPAGAPPVAAITKGSQGSKGTDS
jgi:hypothetical protein